MFRSFKIAQSKEWTTSPLSITILLNLYNQGQQGFAGLQWCSAVGMHSCRDWDSSQARGGAVNPGTALCPCSRQAHSMAGPCAGEEEVAADHHHQGDCPSQMPGQIKEAMATALLVCINGAGRAERECSSNKGLVLGTTRTPPPAWLPFFLLPRREVGKLAGPELTREQRAPQPQSADGNLALLSHPSFS